MRIRGSASALIPLMLVVAACSDLSGPGNSMPTVEITTPKTGTAIIGDSVELTGIAHDDRLISRVTGK